MDINQFFLTLFLILITARILGELFTRVGIPSVLGEVFAGVLLGSSILGVVEPNYVLKVLAEIGIILLLFEVGLETDFMRLKSAGKKAIVVAIMGVLLPFFSGFLGGIYIFELSSDISLFIGGTLTATSIGITLRVLKDIHKEKTNIAQIVIGAAVLDDILGILFLVFIYDYSINQELSLTHTLSVTALIFAFMVFAPIMAKLLSVFIHRFDGITLVPGYMPTIIISMILVFSYLSHLIGAPAILGSFVAGLALSRQFHLPLGKYFESNTTLLKRVSVSMTPIIQLFTPIFFVMVGVSVDFSIIDFSSSTFWYMSLFFIFLALLSKYAGAFFIHEKCLANNSLIGISMIPRGEVGLIFAEMGRSSGIVPIDIYAMLIFVIVVTTVLPPLLLKKYFIFECA